MKNIIKDILKLRWKLTKDTAIAFILGSLVIISSIVLLLFAADTIANRIGFFIVRDIIMVFVLGYAFPLYYTKIIKNEAFSELGIKKENWLPSIILNVVFAIFLLFQFIFLSDEEVEILLSSKAIGPIFYLMVMGIFEIIFFYGFLRQKFEDAFGIIPGIVLAALFYSFHHIGFQPEFFKLFFVGIMYASVFRITKNALAIYPFFWGIGATWDVLVSFGAMEQLADAWIKAYIVFGLMIIFMIYLIRKVKKEHGENLDETSEDIKKF